MELSEMKTQLRKRLGFWRYWMVRIKVQFDLPFQLSMWSERQEMRRIDREIKNRYTISTKSNTPTIDAYFDMHVV